MAGITRVHGGVGQEGVLNGVSGAMIGASVKFYNVVVKEAGAAARDLRPEMAAGTDGGLGGAVEAIMRVAPSGVLAYFVPNNNSGNMHLVVDGHAAPSAASLQTTIRALGTAVGSNSMDVSGTTVTEGTSFSVA